MNSTSNASLMRRIAIDLRHALHAIARKSSLSLLDINALCMRASRSNVMIRLYDL
jgi:hypothetical protein